jgi:transposase
MSTFRPYEPDQQLLLPPSLRDWLPSDHLVWFISETVDQLDLSEIVETYRDAGQGNLPYHPAMMLKILIFAYATGVFSSRGIARQIEENIAFRLLAAENKPDHRTICRFREQHLEAFERLFVQVVQIARDAGLVKMGTLAVDGSKIRANASKRKAMSYERMQEEERRLRKEIRALTSRATKRDAVEDVEFGPDFRGDQLPDELQRREDRLTKIREAKRRLEARKREEATAQKDKEGDDPPPRGGRSRKYPVGKPKPKDQENFTDPESRIMKDGSGAFQQCYNAEIAVDANERIIVAATVQQSASDVPALVPLVDQAKRNTGERAKEVLADAGYASEANLKALERRKIKGYVALGREGKSARAPKPQARATTRMASKLRSKRGRAKYKRRKHLAEPPFGWMKRGLGFRQFSLRGISKVTSEFNLVCLALNLRRMATMMRWT